MTRLQTTEFLRRQNGRCFLSEYGKVIYDAQQPLIANALENYWIPKAIDSLVTKMMTTICLSRKVVIIGSMKSHFRPGYTEETKGRMRNIG